MKKILFLILVLFCLYICGCSTPRMATYNHLYSIVREEKRVKIGFAKKKVVSIRDFRERELYEEDMAALKEEIEKYISLHPELAEETKNNLRELKITAGSTKEEVRLLLGKADKVTQTYNNPYSASERWIYKISKISAFTVFIFPVFPVQEGYYLYFKDNNLTAIERHYLKQSLQSRDTGLYDHIERQEKK